MSTDTYGLSDAVLERAAEVSWKGRGGLAGYYSPRWQREDAEAIRAALPVLVPAIREAVVQEMWRAANSKGADVYQAGMIRFMSADTHWEETAKFIKSFLPADEGSAE